MGFVIDIFLFGLSFVSLAIAGGFATNAAVRITGISGWGSNPDLRSAHRYLSISAVICWVTVAVILVLVFLYIFFGLDIGLEILITLVTYGLLFLSLGAIIVVGVFSAIAAQKIADSKVSDNNESRRQSIIAAVLALVSGVGLLGIIIYRLFFSSDKSDKKTGSRRHKTDNTIGTGCELL